jgi:hypothetical protein
LRAVSDDCLHYSSSHELWSSCKPCYNSRDITFRNYSALIGCAAQFQPDCNPRSTIPTYSGNLHSSRSHLPTRSLDFKWSRTQYSEESEQHSVAESLNSCCDVSENSHLLNSPHMIAAWIHLEDLSMRPFSHGISASQVSCHLSGVTESSPFYEQHSKLYHTHLKQFV